MSKLRNFGLFFLLGGFAAMLLIVLRQSQLQSRADDAARQQTQQLDQLKAENERLAKELAAATNAVAEDHTQDLLRLRNEIGQLRRQTNDLAKLRAENARLQELQSKAATGAPERAADSATIQLKRQAEVKMSESKQLMLALIMFADKNQGHFPTRLDDSNLAAFTNGMAFSGSNQFELVYQGAQGDLGNPASTIVLREQQPWQGPDGNWLKVYGFADGHSEIHSSPTPDFSDWENQRIVAPGQPPAPGQ